jgi:hypothetical protein
MKHIRILMLASVALATPAILQAQIAGDTSGWSRKIDQLYENLRVKLTDAKSRADSLKVKTEANVENAEREARSHLDQLQKRIEQERGKVSAAQADIRDWVEAKKSATAAKIAEWKAKHDISVLQSRADRAERYAAASIDVALAAIDDAEQATLEAWVARQEATSAQAK